MSAGTFFCDTTVLVASSESAHIHHARSLDVVAHAKPARAFCAAHSIAELYATLTASPPPRMRRIDDVLANVEQVLRTFTAVTLTRDEYAWAVRHVAALSGRSGLLYDALILKCAEKSGATTIYTWNTSHFQRIAWAAVAGRIQAP